jgi:hypothetical protein
MIALLERAQLNSWAAHGYLNNTVRYNGKSAFSFRLNGLKDYAALPAACV